MKFDVWVFVLGAFSMIILVLGGVYVCIRIMGKILRELDRDREEREPWQRSLRERRVPKAECEKRVDRRERRKWIRWMKDSFGKKEEEP